MKDGVRIRELQPSDSFANFSLAPEDERLENFFKQDSKEYQRLLLVTFTEIPLSSTKSSVVRVVEIEEASAGTTF